MSDFTSKIIQQKLMEIKGALPATVSRQMADIQSNLNFKELLNQQINEQTSVDASSAGIPKSDTSVGGKSIKSPAELEDIISAAAKKYNISPKVIKAVIKAESSFNTNCVSSAGASGLMQLMPATARGLGVTDVFDPEQNINGGVKYLSYQLKRFDGNLELALAAYNAGPNAVEKYGGIPPYKETENYVKKIMGWINE